MKIVVLCGGLSPERNVSLASGREICRALRRRGHRAVLVDMFLGLEDCRRPLKEIFDVPDGLIREGFLGEREPDLAAVRARRREGGRSLFGRDVLAACAMADIVFLALHGACGEDGRVQAAFDLLGIPYTGAGYLSSAMAMDKAQTKHVMGRLGIPTPPWREITYAAAEIPALAAEIPLPCAVKCVNGGSSLGMALPETRGELEEALRELLRYGGHIVAEEKIRGRDITVGVLGDRYLPAVEMIPQSGSYFDYVSKYQAGGAAELCPAPIAGEQWREMGEQALALHRALGLTVYSRTDFILDMAGNPWCLEINTLPGMTGGSLLPKEAAAAGLSYEDLCEEIVRLSSEARKAELQRTLPCV